MRSTGISIGYTRVVQLLRCVTQAQLRQLTYGSACEASLIGQIRNRHLVKGFKGGRYGWLEAVPDTKNSEAPWPTLDLKELYKSAAGVRVRQHVNPLKSQYQHPQQPPDWSKVFGDSSLPLVIDIGCAQGRFLLALASKLEGHNFLGIDLRQPYIERANIWAKAIGKEKQVCFQYANATISVASMLSNYPGPVMLVAIQFPDPHFKTRHKKRRIVQPQFIADLGKVMTSQGLPLGSGSPLYLARTVTAAAIRAFACHTGCRQVFLQSDIESVTAAMRDEFEEFGSEDFEMAANHDYTAGLLDICTEGRDLPSVNPSVNPLEHQWCRGGYLSENPLGVPTERELQNASEGNLVYRVMLVRK